MKVAHLILAHKNPDQVERLIRALKHPAFYFFIHVDKKSDEKQFDYLCNQDNIKLIRNRTKIYWAGYGTIQATINGFEEILPKGFDYINVISAQDFPIKPAEYIYQFLKERQGREFITCESIEDEWKEAAHRFRDYHLINWRIPGKYRLQYVVNRILPKRKFPLDYKIVGRANWFTITHAAAAYFLDFIEKNPKVVRYFKYCWGADEFIFATVLYNSKFKTAITANLVYVDWTGQKLGHPRILEATDFDKLKLSDKLFARKFDMRARESIFEKLEELIGIKEA